MGQRGQVGRQPLNDLHAITPVSQAAAANRQGTLNSYFDVSLGSGTYAPRRRQAYSSKRLQQVVTDFRAERNKLKNRVTGDAEDNGDGSGEEEGPPRKKRKRKKASQQQTLSKKTRGRKTPPGRSRKGKVAVSSQPGSEQAVTMAETGESPPPPLAVKLRPRAKPIFKGRVIADDENDEGQDDDDDDDEEFVIRQRSEL